jgi:hypothetical protein
MITLNTLTYFLYFIFVSKYLVETMILYSDAADFIEDYIISTIIW